MALLNLEKERAQVSYVLPENTFVGQQDSLLSPPEICKYPHTICAGQLSVVHVIAGARTKCWL